MTAAISPNKSQINPNLVLGLSATFFTLFLFFMDEGLYSFQWMSEPGAWVVFLIYSLPIFAAQLLSYHLVLKNYQGRSKILLSFGLGTAVALFLVISLLS